MQKSITISGYMPTSFVVLESFSQNNTLQAISAPSNQEKDIHTSRCQPSCCTLVTVRAHLTIRSRTALQVIMTATSNHLPIRSRTTLQVILTATSNQETDSHIHVIEKKTHTSRSQTSCCILVSLLFPLDGCTQRMVFRLKLQRACTLRISACLCFCRKQILRTSVLADSLLLHHCCMMLQHNGWQSSDESFMKIQFTCQRLMMTY